MVRSHRGPPRFANKNATFAFCTLPLTAILTAISVRILTPSPAKDLVHLRRRLALQCRHHVRVGVERQADLRVAESFHDRARVDALREQQSRRGVPQVVIPNVREPGIPKDGLEGPVQALRAQRRPYRGREDHP